MSDFKKGDRVTHSMREFPETYTVLRDTANKALVCVTNGRGTQYAFAEKNLTRVETAHPMLGERVQGNGFRDRREEGRRVGVLQNYGDVVSQILLDSGGIGNVFTSTIEAVDEAPKVGDRVRLVHEGVVTGTSGIGSGQTLMIDGHARVLGKGEAVEVLARAPKPLYPIGTAIVFVGVDTAYPLVRDVSGWRGHSGLIHPNITDERVRAGEFKVIYEPAKRG